MRGLYFLPTHSSYEAFPFRFSKTCDRTYPRYSCSKSAILAVWHSDKSPLDRKLLKKLRAVIWKAVVASEMVADLHCHKHMSRSQSSFFDYSTMKLLVSKQHWQLADKTRPVKKSDDIVLLQDIWPTPGKIKKFSCWNLLCKICQLTGEPVKYKKDNYLTTSNTATK